ncbi:MAG: MATE family efflux transporter [Archangium sp.]|nr:MATE family efflux transporter [Archangium sp.]MDP3574322.1 MATE family efflux transporter [Archangium sp.]
MDTPEKTRPATLGTLLALAGPIIISRASQTVVGLSDALMVAHLGAAALASTATGGLNAYTVLILPMGITFIVSSFASQLFGKGDLAGARRYGWYGLLVALATLVLSLIVQPFIEPVLSLLSYSQEVQTLMAGYIRVRLLSAGAAIGIEALANYYGGLGRTWPGMVANLIAMVFNVLGNWLLIDGHWGLPGLGVAGAAWASTIATCIGCLAFIGYFWLDGRPEARARLRLAEFGRMLKFGLPSGFNWLFEFGAFVFFANVVVGGLGTAALAAMNSVMSINSVSFMPAFGLASAGAILVGQAIGAGKKDEVPGIVKLTAFTALAWQCSVGLVCVLIPSLLISFFAKGEGAVDVATIGARMLMISAAWQIFDAIGMSVAESLRGAGDTFFPMIARIAIAWIVFVPGSYITVRFFGWGDVGATLWLVAYLALLAITLFLRFRAGSWRHIVMVEGGVPAH